MNKRDLNLRKRVRALAATECCNYYKGNCIIDEADCHVISDRYDCVSDGMIDCDWFWKAVLPLRSELERELLTELFQMGTAVVKACCRCGRPFVPASKRQRYCSDCRKVGKRVNSQQRIRRYREKQKGGA